MKILVTGSKGFIGKSLVPILANGNDVISTGRSSLLSEDSKDYFSWDLAKESVPWKRIPDDLDVIIHAAASLSQDNMDEELIKANCLGSHRIYQLAKKRNIKKVFYISSIPVIGMPKLLPITEEHPLWPKTMYHVTKLAGEMMLDQLLYDGIEVVHLRIPSPIGPGMPVKTILPIFIKNALNGEKINIIGKGGRRQNYLDVRDLANLLSGCLDKKGIAGVYNIAAPGTVSNLELAELCIKLTGSMSEISFLDKEDEAEGQVWDVDISKAADKLGFHQQYTIQQSITDIANEMRRQKIV